MLGRFSVAAALLVASVACSAGRADRSFEAAQDAHNARQAELLCAFMSLETMFPNPEHRALARAAARGDIPGIEEALSLGASADARGRRGCSVLFWALGGSVEGFRVLLEQGADPNAIFDDGGSVMHWSAQAEDPAYLQLSLRYRGDANLVAGAFGNTPLFEALGSPLLMQALLDAGANVDAQNANGDTPAMVAAGRGRFDAVYFLLERGADSEIANNSGRTLLDRVLEKDGALIPGHELEQWRQRVLSLISASE